MLPTPIRDPRYQKLSPPDSTNTSHQMQYNDARRKPALIVAIASYGTKNDRYLQSLIHEYRSMERYKADIVVLSNIPKDLASDVEVMLGLPTKDPWSLPFAHKDIFARRLQLYDLFIYSEDDTLITERNIDAFLEMTKVLPDTYIAGFIRHAMSPEGKNTHYNHLRPVEPAIPDDNRILDVIRSPYTCQGFDSRSKYPT